MSTARLELQELLKHYAVRNETYHSHKERMAYLPTGIFLLAAFTLATSRDGPYFPTNISVWIPAAGYIISVLVVTFLLATFSLHQLKLKYHAQIRCEAADEALNTILNQVYSDDWAEPTAQSKTDKIKGYVGSAYAPRLYRNCIDIAFERNGRPKWQDRTVLAMYTAGCIVFIARILLVVFSN